MNSDTFNVLKERGFVKQTSSNDVATQLDSEKTVFYVGFDATADSLHVGSMVPIMAVAHLQRMGHYPICIIGGGTTLIGDPSGKTEMRKMLTKEQIESNGEAILDQLKRFVTLNQTDGLFMNNADWLLGIKYIEFLRDIGKHFKVNEMLRSESARLRLERQEGLSFIEFNYQLLQAYDFLYLNQNHNCTLQIGGDDQWGNIVAGINLVKSFNGHKVHALTFPLLTTARGQKMGKTEKGAIWLDEKKTTPFDFYQYWLNVDDRDVIRFLKLFTFVSLEIIQTFENAQGFALKKAKELLAYEVTKMTHGEQNADCVIRDSRALFGAGESQSENVPATEISINELDMGLTLSQLLLRCKLTKSLSEGNRLAEHGGAYLNNARVDQGQRKILPDDLKANSIMLRIGKKKYHKVIFTRGNT